MDTEIGVVEVRRPSYRQALFQAFWGLTSLEGVFFFIWFMRLPLSEAERAVFLGYSFTRLLILLVFGLVVAGAGMVFLQGVFQPEKGLRLQGIVKTWLESQDFAATALLAILAAWTLLGIVLEILLNPAIFPRSILYQFLYIRVRPLFLWTVLTAFQAFLVTLINGWYSLSRDAAAKERRLTLTMVGLGLLLVGNTGLWTAQGVAPQEFAEHAGWVIAGIVLLAGIAISLVVLLKEPIALSRKADPLAETLQPTKIVAAAPRRGRLFTILFGLVAVGMLAWYGISTYLVTPLADPNNMDRVKLLPAIFGFGFNQLRWAPTWLVAAWLILTAAAVWTVIKRPEVAAVKVKAATEFFYSRQLYLVVACIAFVGVSLLLRSHLINDDTLNFMNWMPGQAAHGITHVRFDEMLESNLHFEIYKLANTLWGWDVQFTYNVVSCLMGGVFLFFLLRFCRRLAGPWALALTAFLVSGGFMQLFFGDKENYTIAMTLLMVYLYFAHKFLKSESSLTTPAFFLALAMMFHLETAYLLPSLFYLTIVELNRRRYLTVATAWLLLVAIFSLTMLYFVSRGAAWESLRDTSWGLGRGGNVLFNMVIPTGFMLYARANMMVLIFPMIAFLLPAILASGLKADHLTGFLASAAAVGLPFSCVWISTIGYYSDWNLFSMPMFSVIVLLGVLWFRSRAFPFKNAIAVGMTMVSFLVTYTWIVHNHFLTPR